MSNDGAGLRAIGPAGKRPEGANPDGGRVPPEDKARDKQEKLLQDELDDSFPASGYAVDPSADYCPSLHHLKRAPRPAKQRPRSMAPGACCASSLEPISR